MKPNHHYTQAMDDFLKQNRTLPRKELTEKFNTLFGTQKTIAAIAIRCKKKGWLSGRAGHFTPGHQPWNTGTKGIMKANSTSYKKGQTPPNKKPIGAERICAKDGYILIKTAEPNKWEHKHRVIWEQHHGKVLAGYNLVFKNNNKLDCTLENLELISKQEHCRRNKLQISKQPAEIQPTLKLVAKLQATAAQKRRKKTA